MVSPQLPSSWLFLMRAKACAAPGIAALQVPMLSRMRRSSRKGPFSPSVLLQSTPCPGDPTTPHPTHPVSLGRPGMVGSFQGEAWGQGHICHDCGRPVIGSQGHMSGQLVCGQHWGAVIMEKSGSPGHTPPHHHRGNCFKKSSWLVRTAEFPRGFPPVLNRSRFVGVHVCVTQQKSALNVK